MDMEHIYKILELKIDVHIRIPEELLGIGARSRSWRQERYVKRESKRESKREGVCCVLCEKGCPDTGFARGCTSPPFAVAKS